MGEHADGGQRSVDLLSASHVVAVAYGETAMAMSQALASGPYDDAGQSQQDIVVSRQDTSAWESPPPPCNVCARALLFPSVNSAVPTRDKGAYHERTALTSPR
jgi:hypothetical protein